MAELDPEIVYRPGKKNVVTDVFSRYGVEVLPRPLPVLSIVLVITV